MNKIEELNKLLENEPEYNYGWYIHDADEYIRGPYKNREEAEKHISPEDVAAGQDVGFGYLNSKKAFVKCYVATRKRV